MMFCGGGPQEGPKYNESFLDLHNCIKDGAY